MTRENPIIRAQAIVNALRKHPGGASLEQIASDMNPPPPNRRALQRWLLDLIGQGRVMRTGKARACRYTLSESQAKQGNWVYASEAEYITPNKVRSGACKVGEITTRGPMAYLSNLLEAYNPNTSYYLDEQIRAQLHAMGTGSASGNGGSKTATRTALDIASPSKTSPFTILHTELAFNSSRLEGISYSLPEAEALLHAGRWASERSSWEAQLLLNHKEAIDFIVERDESSHSEPILKRGFEASFDPYTLLNLQALLTNNLISPRTQPNIQLNALHNSDQINQFLSKAQQIVDPFEQSFFAWVHLSHLQVFEAFNNPVSRLMANLPLLQNQLYPLTFVDVPHTLYMQVALSVYEPFQIATLRDFYVWAYTRSCKQGAAASQVICPDPFKIQHRELISSAVCKAVREKLAQNKIAPFVDHLASHNLPRADRARFYEVVTQELMGLNEGNIARFKIKRSEWRNWGLAH